MVKLSRTTKQLYFYFLILLDVEQRTYNLFTYCDMNYYWLYAECLRIVYIQSALCTPGWKYSSSARQ